VGGFIKSMFLQQPVLTTRHKRDKVRVFSIRYEIQKCQFDSFFMLKKVKECQFDSKKPIEMGWYKACNPVKRKR
jgi:hypothetical protein